MKIHRSSLVALVSTVSLLSLGSGAYASDWSGGYIGLTLNGNNSSTSLTADGDSQTPTDTTTLAVIPTTPSGDTLSAAHLQQDRTSVSLLGGYLFQSGNIVYGGELQLSSKPSEGASALASIAGRIGYAFEKSMVYASLGAARYSGDLRTSTGENTLDFNGIRVALGAEFKLTETGALRTEISHSAFERENFGTSGSIKPEFTQFSIGYIHRF